MPRYSTHVFNPYRHVDKGQLLEDFEDRVADGRDLELPERYSVHDLRFILDRDDKALQTEAEQRSRRRLIRRTGLRPLTSWTIEDVRKGRFSDDTLLTSGLPASSLRAPVKREFIEEQDDDRQLLKKRVKREPSPGMPESNNDEMDGAAISHPEVSATEPRRRLAKKPLIKQESVSPPEVSATESRRRLAKKPLIKQESVSPPEVSATEPSARFSTSSIRHREIIDLTIDSSDL